MKDDLILVNENDEIVGNAKKMEVHLKGFLHRAFSILILNSKGELLIQQRAKEKYHSKGLWSNTCCSHQIYGENDDDVIKKRLLFEMGFSCEVKYSYSFTYKVEFENGLIENELDKVYFGEYNGEVKPNSKEVLSFRWINLEQLRKEMKDCPNEFTYWFKIIVNEHLEDFDFISFVKK